MDIKQKSIKALESLVASGKIESYKIEENEINGLIEYTAWVKPIIPVNHISISVVVER